MRSALLIKGPVCFALAVLYTGILNAALQAVSVSNETVRIEVPAGSLFKLEACHSDGSGKASVVNGNRSCPVFATEFKVAFIPGPCAVDLCGAPVVKYAGSAYPINETNGVEYVYTSGCALFVYELLDNPPSPQPSTGVVIPSDGAGPVRVILESSSDLVTWSEALPGTYGRTETKRFFRLRIMNN
jgi:hypothetical protein